jgi:hypothetical protein
MYLDVQIHTHIDGWESQGLAQKVKNKNKFSKTELLVITENFLHTKCDTDTKYSLSLKGQCHENFDFRFYSKLKVHRRCR